ncbi:MAG TPA: glycogen debranching enzyme N-terminal domain-containing protein, partial [Candidatus Acidoferrum sp.]|nr:glycogen debranching enzyme N-terminal domain-containing protein [Candidatus Acidoferrum sp.]
MRFGRALCGDLGAASEREWLVPDGLGGYAMGTVGGLRTRRYHGLLIVATRPPGGRMLGLAAIDPILVIGDRRIPLAAHEWSSGAIDPNGYIHLE